MQFRAFLIVLLACSALAEGAAAQRSQVEVSAGCGLSVQTNRKSSAAHLADWGAHILVAPHIALGPHLFLKTGAGYAQRNTRLRLERLDEDDHRNVYDIRNRFQMITIPLQVGADIGIRGMKRLQLSGGMSYHFLLAARVDSRVRAYGKTGVLFQDQQISYRPGIFLAPPANRLNASNETGFLRFTPAIQIDAGYLIREHIRAGVFYEYDLQDLATSYASAGTGRLHYGGLSLAWLF